MGASATLLKDRNTVPLKAVSPRDNEGDPSRSWPRGFCADPVFSIGQVVEQIRTEFPALSVSKVRFLEDKGLIHPFRTGSGYRKYSAADIERIRFCLSAQRDSYLPLSVIREQLDQLDAGYEVEVVPAAALVSADGELVSVPKPDSTITVRQIMDMTGIDRQELDELVAIGLITPDLGGRLPGRALAIVQLTLLIGKEGVALRNLRPLRLAAERSSDILEQLLGAVARPEDSPVVRERKLARASELANILARLQVELIHQSAEQLMK